MYTLARIAGDHSKVTSDDRQVSSTQYWTDYIITLVIKNYSLNLVTSR